MFFVDPRAAVTLSTEQLRLLGPGVMVFEVRLYTTDQYDAIYGSGDGYTASFNVTLLPVSNVGVEAPSVVVAPLSVRKLLSSRTTVFDQLSVLFPDVCTMFLLGW